MSPRGIQICKVAFAGFVYSERDENKQGRHKNILTDVVVDRDAFPDPLAPSLYPPMSCYVLLAGP